MRSELKYKLYGLIKENFFLYTSLDDYGNFKIDFEIDEDSVTDDEIECDIIIKGHHEETNLRVSANKKEEFKVNCYEDVWEDWGGYGSNLLRQMFFSKREVEETT